MTSTNPDCQRRLRAKGAAYPRTCTVCGLFGPCRDAKFAFTAIPERAADADQAATTPPTDPAHMTADEAYVLHRWHKDAEASHAKSGNYAQAMEHKERAAEIGRVFWPADAWERAWSAQV